MSRVRLALAPQQDEQSSIADPAALVRQLAQSRRQGRIRRPAGAIADHRAIRGNQGAGPTLAHLHGAAQMSDGFALGGGPTIFL
jgi:hypothetical protein